MVGNPQGFFDELKGVCPYGDPDGPNVPPGRLVAFPAANRTGRNALEAFRRDVIKMAHGGIKRFWNIAIFLRLSALR